MRVEGQTEGWAAAAAAADLTLDLDGEPMFFRLVPAGSFVMGSRGYHADEEPRHRVVIEQPFYMATFAVTQRQFRCWNRSHRSYFDGDHRPVENVTWDEARGYCAWLQSFVKPAGFPSELAGLQWSCDLPTEVEWEYACRAGTETEYCSGDGGAALRIVGCFSSVTERRTAEVGTAEVGTYAPNAWDLYDMHGNVWEWCADAWDKAAYRMRVDGYRYDFVEARASVPGDEQAMRVLRGGSWGRPAGGCRSADRSGWRPGNRNRDQGFRACLFPGPRAQAKQPDGKAEAREEPSRPGTGRGGPDRAGAPSGEYRLDREHLPPRSCGEPSEE